MKSILIALVLLLSGCATTSDTNLLKGELYVGKKKYTKSEVVHRIEFDDENFYQFEFHWR